MTNVLDTDKPHVKEHRGHHICFADTLAQANTALAERSGGKAAEDLAKADHLMLFGVDKWDDNELATFSKNLQTSQFDRVEIFGSNLTDAHQRTLAQGFQNLTARKLDLDNTELSKVGAEAIMKEIGQTGVEEINLQGSIKNTEVMKATLEGLVGSTSLKKLDFKINDIKDTAGKAIEEFMLKTKATGLELDFFYNALNAQGAARVANGLASNSIVLLDLCCNDIGDDGAVALSNTLIGNTSLRSLKLALNNIGNKGAMAIFSTIVVKANTKNANVTLKELDLSANVMKETDADVEEKENPTITSSLIDVIYYGVGLTDFDFTGIELTKSGWERLANAFTVAHNQFPQTQNLVHKQLQDKTMFDLNVTRFIRFSIVDLMSEENLKLMERAIWEGELSEAFNYIDWRRKKQPETNEEKAKDA